MFRGRMHRGDFERNFSHQHWPMFFDRMKDWKEKRWNWEQEDYSLDQNSFSFLMMYIINEKPSYGYEIIKAIEQKFDGNYSPSPESVYPGLSKLEDLGFITGNTENGKKIYSITEEGKAYLETNKEKIDEILANIEKAKQSVNGNDLRELFKSIRIIGKLLVEGYREKNWGKDQIKRLQAILENTANEIKSI